MGTIKNLDKINYRKRDAVERGLRFIDEHNQNHVIQKVIVFGSAIREDCRNRSDIDLCLVSDFECKTNEEYKYIYTFLGVTMDDNIDLFNYKRLKDDRFRANIDKGVIVYEY